MGGLDNVRTGRFANLTAFRALRYRDFRLLWIGAFLSFTGSVVQNVAQQDLVLEMTGSRAKLAMVSFCMMFPVSLLGPVLGVAADMYNKKKLLVACMVVSAIGPIFLGIAVNSHFAQYWMFLAVASVAGVVQCVEVPTRQSIVRSVVDERDVAVAIPAQASTFNLARVIGPAIAVAIVLTWGSAFCFWANGISYFALAVAALAFRTDLRPVAVRVEPIKDLVAEGFKYTFRQPGLRTLFLMESATAVFGAFYMSQMSAIVRQHLGLDEHGLSAAFTSVGVGSLCGLFLTASLSGRPWKPALVLVSMSLMAASIVMLGLVTVPWIVFFLMGLTGACMIIQFNTTNTLFQLQSPPALRGRVISMHMWAISGLAPIGVFFFGYFSEFRGVAAALVTGGALLAVSSVWAWFNRKVVVEPVLGAENGAA